MGSAPFTFTESSVTAAGIGKFKNIRIDETRH